MSDPCQQTWDWARDYSPAHEALCIWRRPKGQEEEVRTLKHHSNTRELHFLCKIKYQSSPPLVPAEPKFLKCPLEEDRYVKYKETSLERNFKWDLIPDADVGVSLDLIDLRAYALPDHPRPLDPIDAKLCASMCALTCLT